MHCRKKEGDLLREYKAMHEENCPSTWLREDVESTEERRNDMDKEAREEESMSGKRVVQREEEKTVVKRRCVNRFPDAILRIFIPWKCWVVFGCRCGDPCGGSGGSSEWGVRGVPVSPWLVGLGVDSLSVSDYLMYRSPCLSP